MFDAIRFWLDKGVDGFRVDVIYYMIKDDRVPRQPTQPRLPAGTGPVRSQIPLYSYNRPEVHDIIRACARCSTGTRTG